MASVPTPHQFAVGEVVTADNINTYFTAISYLENPPIASLFQSVAQNVLTSGSATPITFDGSLIDTYNGHSISVNNTRYTFQVAGIYLCAGSSAWVPNATGVRTSSFRLNGTTALIGSQITTQAITTGGVNTNVPATTVVTQANVGDYIELLGTQTSGGALSTQVGGNNTSTMTIVWLHA